MASSTLFTLCRLSSGRRNVMVNMTHNWSKLYMQGYYEPTTVAVLNRHFHSVKRIDPAPISSSHFKFLTGINGYVYSQHSLHNTFHPEDKQKGTLPKSDSTPKSQEVKAAADDLEKFNKLTYFQKFQAMYRDYWFVLIPVHLVSSVIFFGSFYYAAASGVDVVALLQRLHFSESWINPLRNSSVGYIAIAYLLYKLFTPIRYTVTLGGTTWAIRFLKTRGWIRPRPIRDPIQDLKNMVQAMKLPGNERQKFLEDKGVSRFGKAVCRALSSSSDSSSNCKK